MVFFFFVVALEIRLGARARRAAGSARRRGAGARRARRDGRSGAALRRRQRRRRRGAHGWGIPMATDIAFALGVARALGRACRRRCSVFLLTLAIVDDIGAIVVIAIFYSEGIDLVALAAAAGIVVVIGLLGRVPSGAGRPTSSSGLALWVAMVESGVHPTIAGVLLGLLTPVHPPLRSEVERATVLTRSFRQDRRPRRPARRCRGGRGHLAQRAPAGAAAPVDRATSSCRCSRSRTRAPLGGDALSRAVGSPITIGIVVGLVAGKTIGISFEVLPRRPPRAGHPCRAA